MSRRFCLTLDLKNEPKLIAEYKRHHEKIWPEITQSNKGSGIEDLEIYIASPSTKRPKPTSGVPRCRSGKNSCGNSRSRFRKLNGARSG